MQMWKKEKEKEVFMAERCEDLEVLDEKGQKPKSIAADTGKEWPKPMVGQWKKECL